jgi:hypothetical protein
VALIWTVACVCGIAALLFFSYRRLATLRRCERWAAPLLERARQNTPGSSSEEFEEATSELRYQLRAPSLVPRGCAKAAFWLGAAAALMQTARQLGEGDARDWIAPVLSLATGCMGALGCSFIGRTAEVEARRLRDAWNTLIRRSTRDVRT